MPTSGGVFWGLSPAVSWSVAERRAPLEILEGLSTLFSAGWKARSTRRSGNGAPVPTVGVIDFPGDCPRCILVISPGGSVAERRTPLGSAADLPRRGGF
jgi:hypothetical protein